MVVHDHYELPLSPGPWLTPKDSALSLIFATNFGVRYSRASILLERAGSMAVSHGAACYGGYASPVAQPTECRRLPQARASLDMGFVMGYRLHIPLSLKRFNEHPCTACML